MITPEEFVTWFLGFSDAIKGRPTREQWETFKAKHAEAMAEVVRRKLVPEPAPVAQPLPWTITPTYQPYQYWDTGAPPHVHGSFTTSGT